MRAAGGVIARTDRALVLREGGYEPVVYIPPADVDFALLEATEHTTYCPYKGDASYYSIPAGGERAQNAAWQYQSAFPAVAQIEGYLAFYPDRVDEIG